MSRSSRPISLRSTIVIRRAQAEQQRRRLASPPSVPEVRRPAFSFRSLFGPKPMVAANDVEEVQRTLRAA